MYGYTLAFSGDGAVIGNFDRVFLLGITPDTLSSTMKTVPEYVFVAFQGTFAAITAALIVGAFAERIRFAAVMLFMVLWFTFSYIPLAHIVWGGGFLADDGALDFAGGTVVHINAGIAALVGAYMVGKRIGLGKDAFMPHSLTLTMVGASLLWVGWFGFNAGSAGAANGTAGLAFVNTVVATAAATLSWLAGEAFHKGKASMLGAASGAVAGTGCRDSGSRVCRSDGLDRTGADFRDCLFVECQLVQENPECGRCVRRFRGSRGRRYCGCDPDRCGGFSGTGWNGSFRRRLFDGMAGLDTGQERSRDDWLGPGIVSFIAYKISDKVFGLRVSEEEERAGLDNTSHGESAYRY